MEKGTMSAITKVINLAVDKAVERALFSGYIQWEKSTKDIYAQTEQRLYAYPVLIDKLELDTEQLAEYKKGKKRDRSKSVHIARHNTTGNRLDPDEILDALIQDLTAEIAKTKHEINIIELALKKIEDDQYYSVIYGRFVEGRTDADIAENDAHCDDSTVRRNRGRLVRRIAVFLYGPEAVIGTRPGQLRR